MYFSLLLVSPKDDNKRGKKKSLKEIIKEKILKVNESPEKKALSIAYGIFWGIFPAWGFQLAICIPTAIALRLNVALVILVLQNYWWMWGPVGIVISVFVLCVNFIGDGLRDSTDPSQQG